MRYGSGRGSARTTWATHWGCRIRRSDGSSASSTRPCRSWTWPSCQPSWGWTCPCGSSRPETRCATPPSSLSSSGCVGVSTPHWVGAPRSRCRSPGDRRAWDAVVRGRGWCAGVEAETRLRDAQATARRIGLKARDGDVDHVVLLLADTRRNREALAVAREALRGAFPRDSRAMERLGDRAAKETSGTRVLEASTRCPSLV